MKHRGDINFGCGDFPSRTTRSLAERLSRPEPAAHADAGELDTPDICPAARAMGRASGDRIVDDDLVMSR
jgi:hypothetical protein